MCSLVDDSDMAVDVINRVCRVMSFVEEALIDGRGPNDGLTLSPEALDGLAIIAREVNHALRQAGEMV